MSRPRCIPIDVGNAKATITTRVGQWVHVDRFSSAYFRARRRRQPAGRAHRVGEVGGGAGSRDLERVQRYCHERGGREGEVGVEQQRAFADRAAGSVGHERVPAAVATLVEQGAEH